MSLIIGAHINISNGFTSTVDYANSIGCNVFQMFISNPQSNKASRKNLKDLKIIKDKSKNLNIKIVIHASYTLNFCHPENAPIHKNAVDALVSNILDANEMDTLGVVVHMGKNIKALKITDKEALNNYVLGIKNVIKKTSETNQKILFETGASCGNEICSSIEGLSELYNSFTEEEKKRIGICIDTCHIFASGYDISTKEGVKNFYTKFKELIGWEKVVCVHLNDSLDEVHSCCDHHADIGRGQIGELGLRVFSKLCYKYEIPMILETKEFYYNDKNVIEKDETQFAQCIQFTYKDQIDLVKLWISKWKNKKNIK